MIVTCDVVFKGRRDPVDYDMSDRGGPVGTSYSFFVLDEDDAKQKVKCSRETWEALAGLEKGDRIRITVEAKDCKLVSQDSIAVLDHAAA